MLRISRTSFIQGNCAATFVLNNWMRGFLLSAFANCFELRCELKQLTLMYNKDSPCFLYRKYSLVHCCIQIHCGTYHGLLSL